MTISTARIKWFSSDTVLTVNFLYSSKTLRLYHKLLLIEICKKVFCSPSNVVSVEIIWTQNPKIRFDIKRSSWRWDIWYVTYLTLMAHESLVLSEIVERFKLAINYPLYHINYIFFNIFLWIWFISYKS